MLAEEIGRLIYYALSTPLTMDDSSGVTLLLGEQMAVVFLGLNVLFPLTLSALLALIVLIIVQTSRLIKRTMGRANSKEINNTKMDDIRQSKQTPVKSIDTDGIQENGTGNSIVRKRRSSVVQQIESSHNSLTQETPTSIRTPVQNSTPPSSQSSSGNRSPDSVTPFRKHRIGSGNRISPIAQSGDNQNKKPNNVSWAWMDQNSHPIKRGSRGDDSRNITNRKELGRIVSPSQCQIQTFTPDNHVKRNVGLFQDEEMKAYDIW